MPLSPRRLAALRDRRRANAMRMHRLWSPHIRTATRYRGPTTFPVIPNYGRERGTYRGTIGRPSLGHDKRVAAAVIRRHARRFLTRRQLQRPYRIQRGTGLSLDVSRLIGQFAGLGYRHPRRTVQFPSGYHPNQFRQLRNKRKRS